MKTKFLAGVAGLFVALGAGAVAEKASAMPWGGSCVNCTSRVAPFYQKTMNLEIGQWEYPAHTVGSTTYLNEGNAALDLSNYNGGQFWREANSLLGGAGLIEEGGAFSGRFSNTDMLIHVNAFNRAGYWCRWAGEDKGSNRSATFSGLHIEACG